MKTRGLFLVASAFLPVTVRGDLTIVQKVEGVGSFKEITTKLKDDKLKVPNLQKMFSEKPPVAPATKP